MRVKQSLRLSIPSPCNEDWEKMSMNEKGRHCANCNNTVVDFSLFSDRQVIEFFAKARGKVCGRFSSFQLNRELVYIEPSNHFLYKLLFGTALTLGIAGSANANYNPNQKPLVEQYVQQREANKEPENTLGGDDNKNTVKITILDSANKSGIPFVALVVTYNGEQIGTGYTDINGLAEITMPDSVTGKKITIKAVYPGYKDHTSEFIASQGNNSIKIMINPGPVIILGGPMFISRPLPDPTHYSIHKGDTPLW
jgi:hypothetical protein